MSQQINNVLKPTLANTVDNTANATHERREHVSIRRAGQPCEETRLKPSGGAQLRVATGNITEALLEGKGFFEMVASRDIPAGTEVRSFNTYTMYIIKYITRTSRNTNRARVGFGGLERRLWT
eukprot:4311255-Pyramimonas_sp.AAC.1